MSFASLTKNVAKIKSPLLIGYPQIWFDFFIFGTLIMIALDCDATFWPSTFGSMKWLYLKVHMLPVKEKCKCISKC